MRSLPTSSPGLLRENPWGRGWECPPPPGIRINTEFEARILFQIPSSYGKYQSRRSPCAEGRSKSSPTENVSYPDHAALYLTIIKSWHLWHLTSLHCPSCRDVDSSLANCRPTTATRQRSKKGDRQRPEQRQAPLRINRADVPS